jgi:HEAT repeat protein
MPDFDPKRSLPFLAGLGESAQMTPNDMIECLLDSRSDARDGVANELLAEFSRGYPIQNLRRLFVPSAIGSAAFIVSELGQKARPLIKEIVELLNDKTPRVRGDAISALSQCATWDDGWAVAKIIMGLGDGHDGVRWMASRALRYMDSDQLLAGLEHLYAEQPNSVYADFKNAFLALERRPKTATATLKRLLGHEDIIARRFGAAMAARPRLCMDRAFIALAEAARDPEVVEIVREAAEAPLPPWAIWVDTRDTSSE